MAFQQIFPYYYLSFLGGIFIASFFEFSLLILLVLAVSALIPLTLFWREKRIVFAGFCILFFILGFWFCQESQFKIKESVLREINDSGREIVLIGTISEEPDARENNIKLTIDPENIHFKGSAENIFLQDKGNFGKVLITIDPYPEYKYGDKLEITGEIENPFEFQDFNYRDYLAKDGIYSVMYKPETKLLSRGEYKGISFIYANVLRLKNKLRQNIESNLPPSLSCLLNAVILGDKKRISSQLKEKLNLTGLRHVVAVSGMHVAILSAVLMAFLLGIGICKRHAFYFLMVMIVFFIAITGFQSSAIRAGIMASLVLYAEHSGRRGSGMRLLVFAALLMLLFNPLLLRYDIGFQLSFLAVLGIIYFSSPLKNYIEKRLYMVPNFANFKEILAVTFSAQIFTLPLLVYNFGYFSLVSPLTNILVVPVLPYVMVSGFVFAFLGIFSRNLAWVFSLPAHFLLSYLDSVVDLFSRISHSCVFFKISWFWLIPVYFLLFWWGYLFAKRREKNFLNYS